ETNRVACGAGEPLGLLIAALRPGDEGICAERGWQLRSTGEKGHRPVPPQLHRHSDRLHVRPGRIGHRAVERAKDEGRARLELEVHLRLAVRPRAELREAGSLAHGVHDRYRGSGHGQWYPVVQRSRPAVTDEVVMASLVSPPNEPHPRVIHHPLAM